MPAFSKEDLLNMETNEAMETTFSPVPEGEYIGQISKVDTNLVGADKDKPVLNIVWELPEVPDAVKAEVGMEKPTVRQSIWLDVENGRLAQGKNKNVTLGRLREAVGQNTAGRWSIQMLLGQRAKIRVAHRQDTNSDATFAEVKATVALR